MISPRTKSIFAILLVSMVIFAVVIQFAQAGPTLSGDDDSEEKKQSLVSLIKLRDSSLRTL